MSDIEYAGAETPEWVRRAVRTLGQLIASGALTYVVGLIADGLEPATAAIVLALWQVVVTAVHNYLEDAGIVPTVLKAPPLPPDPPGPAGPGDLDGYGV